MLDVLLEDNHCLAVNKPAGLLSQGDETGGEVALARDRLGPAENRGDSNRVGSRQRQVFRGKSPIDRHKLDLVTMTNVRWS